MLQCCPFSLMMPPIVGGQDPARRKSFSPIPSRHPGGGKDKINLITSEKNCARLFLLSTLADRLLAAATHTPTRMEKFLMKI